MSLDINDLSTAATLCTCNGHCSRQCSVCQAPMWKGQRACVKALYDSIIESGGSSPASTVADEKIEEFIDMMEEHGMPLVPWQAAAFRAIMKHDGKVAIAQPLSRKRYY